MRKEKGTPMELALAPLPAPAEATAGTQEMPARPARTTDGDLIAAIARGDRAAFEQLYHRYARAVLGYALRRLGDRDSAEEAVQETFAAVWRSARTFRRDRGAGSAWLFAVARNAIVDRFRDRRGDLSNDLPDRPSGEAGPAERAETEWLGWRVHRALEDLPDGERTVLELAYWSGLSQSEIADFLQIPLGTVKTRTRSALGRLATVLDGEDVR